MAENLKDYGVQDSDTNRMCLGEIEVYEELCEGLNPELGVPDESTNSKLGVPDESINPKLGVIDEAFNSERGRNLCLMKIYGGLYGGYKKEIITENMTERELTTYICPKCEGIVRDACTSKSGKPICSSCTMENVGGPPLTAPCVNRPNNYMRNMITSLKCSCPLIYPRL